MVKRVLDVPYPCDVELVIVDDGSSDGTAALLAAIDDPRVSVHTHPVNRGKGAAIRTAAAAATGTHVVMCDADLEYSPEDLPALLRPVLDGEAEVVYGTRSFSSHTAFSFWFVLGNKGVTFFANALFDSWISDLETCFKLMPLDALPFAGRALGRLRHGGRDHRQAAQAGHPAVRGADPLPGPQPGRGQEADLAGRRRGDLDPDPHPASAGPAERPWRRRVRSRRGSAR